MKGRRMEWPDIVFCASVHSDSSDESSTDAEEEEEEEEEEGKARGKLLLQVKKEILSADLSGEDPVAKLLKVREQSA